MTDNSNRNRTATATDSCKTIGEVLSRHLPTIQDGRTFLSVDANPDGSDLREELYGLLCIAYAATVGDRCREMVYTEHILRHLGEFADFLCQPSHRFWILFCGTPGNGKTTLIKAVQKLVNHLWACNRIHRKVSLELWTAKEIFNVHFKEAETYRRLIRLPWLAIDELGEEPREGMEYGNIITPVSDLLELRYREMKPTVIATNLTTADIAGRYGQRLADRFAECCKVINFADDESFRR